MGKISVEKGRSSETAVITCAEYLKFAPAKEQLRNGKGEVIYDKEKVAAIRKTGSLSACRNEARLITIDVLNKRLSSGNHRQVAIAEDIEAGVVSLYDKILVSLIYTDGSAEARRELIIDQVNGNRGNNKSNRYVAVHADKDHVVSKELVGPAFKAIEKALNALPVEYKKPFNMNRKYQLAQYLGAYFNNNPSQLEAMRKGQAITVTGAALYNMRHDKLANGSPDWTLIDEVNVSLRDSVELLATRLIPGLNFIGKLKTSGLWSDKFRSKSNPDYIFIAQSLSNQLSDKVLKKMEKNIQTVGSKLNQVFQKDFVNKPETAEDTILSLLLS